MKRVYIIGRKIDMLLKMIKGNLKGKENTEKKLLKASYNNRIINEYCALRGKINTDSFRKDL